MIDERTAFTGQMCEIYGFVLNALKAKYDSFFYMIWYVHKLLFKQWGSGMQKHMLKGMWEFLDCLSTTK